MPLSDTITLDDAVRGDVHYNLISKVGNTSTRLDSGSTLAQPQELFISHQKTSGGGVVTDRHLVSFRKTKVNAQGDPLTVVVNFTVAVPRDTVFTTPEITALVRHLMDFLQDGAAPSWTGTDNWDAILLNGI
jgi:hypothetical protein